MSTDIDLTKEDRLKYYRQAEEAWPRHHSHNFRIGDTANAWLTGYANALADRATSEPNKLHQALYAAVNDMMIVIGMHGSIDRRDDRVTHVMDALHAIDGGVYKPLETNGERP